MLTEAQLPTLKTAILAETDAEFVALRTAGATGAMADWYNVNSTFVVWKTNVAPEDYRKVGFVWSEVDSLTAGKARIIEWLTGDLTLPFNASDANVRQGLADAFASNTTTRANLLALSKRFASRGEKLYASGTGTDATPGLLGYEGVISNDDVIRALGS